jgi:hypothetical protein
MTEKKVANEIEAQAWQQEPPRSSIPLSMEDQFCRAALSWGRIWIGRHHARTAFESQPPFAIVLGEPVLVEDEPLLAGLTVTPYPLASFPFPLNGNLFVSKEVVKHAAATSIDATGIDGLISGLWARGFSQRPLLIVDPLSRAMGIHVPVHDLLDIETFEVPIGPEPVLSVEKIDEVLGDFHKAAVRLPKKWTRTGIWKNPDDDSCYKTVSKPEHTIHAALYLFLVARFNEKRIHTDYEVQAPSGRVDIRVLESVGHALAWMWLELKVLKESAGPAGRQKLAEECIAQARARFDEQPQSTKGTFACCYDASKQRLPFSEETQALAAKHPEVKLRQYEVLKKLYEVAAAK